MTAGPEAQAGRRVLLLTYAYPPDPLSGGARPGRFARYLPAHGYDVDVIAAGDGEGARVRRVPARAGPGPAPVLSRIAHVVRRGLPHDDELAWASHVWALGRRTMRRARYDAILSTSPPGGAHVAACLLQQEFGVPWVCDFRDPMLDSPSRGRPWFFPHDRWLERWLCTRADAIVCNTDVLAGLLRERYSTRRDTIHTIWNGYDPEEKIDAGAPQQRRRRVLAHVGTLYGARHPGLVVESLLRLLEAGRVDADRVLLQLAGPVEPGCLQPVSVQIGKLEERGCLEILNRTLSQREANDIAGAADFLVLLDVNYGYTTIQVPGKLFQYIRTGIPIAAITRRGSPSERILAGAGVKYVCMDPHDDAERRDEALLRLIQMPQERTSPSEWFLEQFDGERQVVQLAGILDGLLRRGEG